MASGTFLLLHGAGSSGWYWHRVEPLLARAGYRTVAPSLPVDDPAADLGAYVDTATGALGDSWAPPLVVVGMSMSGFIAPLVADTLGADRLVLLAAMIPTKGESGLDWWANTGQVEAKRHNLETLGLAPELGDDPDVMFGHDLPRDLWSENVSRDREQSRRPFEDPWPLENWPAMPTTVVAPRDDRLFPLEFQRRMARDRLGLDVRVIPGGHLPALSQPEAVARALLDSLEPR